MDQLVTLVGTARPKPERAEELKQLLLSFVEPTRQEPGCLEYHVHEDRDEPGVFVFYEAWRSQADLDAHLALPHLRDFRERRMDYLAEDLEIRFLTMRSPYTRA
ncbi:putative quinol monooxygenase [Streptomyces sp. CB01881]|uniref:putative quinol monooxygenase n=1 Tax=Streptomyces sp. CB01881 TaxID=2078691 RepID=UPI000CDC03A9|nr:putative quinol monooxygenase [Streptomyces sp. CB01881]AUY49371.1 antibiotic biosynthesis monooxygenase [Streptomyces sp. CB01881]TYC72760.1 antibiotic biosynthesis monooxygenase [Streptomyces sp. CB01881]